MWRAPTKRNRIKKTTRENRERQNRVLVYAYITTYKRWAEPYLEPFGGPIYFLFLVSSPTLS